MSEPALVDIGGRRLRASLRGTGPILVLEAGGGNGGIGYAAALVDRITAFATVLTYDRAGLGRSDPPPIAPTAATMAVDLNALLNALGAARPVFLSGYSLSALSVQLYACKYPREVAGLILFDPTPDEMFSALPAGLQIAPQAMAMVGGGASPGMRLELEKFFESCREVANAVSEGRLPDVPLTVVTAAKRGDWAAAVSAQTSLSQRHQKISERTKSGRLLIAEHSRHDSIFVDDADLAVEAIRAMVQPAPK